MPASLLPVAATADARDDGDVQAWLARSTGTRSSKRSTLSSSSKATTTSATSVSHLISKKQLMPVQEPYETVVSPGSPFRIARVAASADQGRGQLWGWRWLRSEFFSWLIVFAPVAIAMGAKGLSPRLVFAMSALSLAGLEVFISTTLEHICLDLSSQHLLAAVCLEGIPSIFPTMISIVALVSDEIGIAKSFVVGNVLNNILLGTGAALFIGGLKPNYEGYAQHVSETAFELIKLTIASTSPVIMAWSMIYVMTSKTESAGDDSDSTIISAKTEAAIKGLSRGTALILLAVYICWILFRRVTHRSLFAGDDHDRQAAANAVKERSHPGSKHMRQREKGKDRAKESVSAKSPTPSWSSAAHSVSWLPSRLPAVVSLAMASTILATALAAAVFCCHYLVVSIDAVVTTSSASSGANTNETEPASLHRHFVASILMPLIVNLYSYVRAAELASCGGHDVSLAVHLTYGAGASSILLTLPILVVVGWASGHTLLLDFSSFDVSILAGGVWATSILTTSQVDYLRGFVFLCLYIILALALFLYRE